MPALPEAIRNRRDSKSPAVGSLYILINCASKKGVLGFWGANYLGAKYLKGCTLYVTLEPFCMCAGALYWSQIDKIVYGARDLKRGAGNHGNKLYHPSSLVINGILEEDCAQLMKDFFYEKRK